MFWYILILLFICLILWILLVPVIVYTDTTRNLYYMGLPGIVKAQLVPTEELFQIRGWIFFIPYRLNPFKQRKKKEKSKSDRKKKKKWPKLGNIRMVPGALRAFRIKKLELDIDTDDFTRNAWLIPAFSMVNGKNIHMRVNFEGTASMVLDLRITLGLLLWSIIRTKYKSFSNN